MTEKRFRTGKGILEEGYFSETIIDNETGKAYYKGYANYKSAKEMCELLNKLADENEQLKKVLGAILLEVKQDISNTHQTGDTFKRSKKMTVKRFTLKYIKEQHLSANLYDDKTFIGSIGVGAELIVELLNTLSDENEQLKARIKYLERKIQRERMSYQKQHEKWEKELNKNG